MAGFQVQGNEEEFLALACADFVNGEGTPVEDDSSRGTEVASGFEWVEGEAAVLIHVPLAAIGAGPGAVLEDIYALTYISASLFVDDAAPDAKSDRDADESFGTYTIGGSGSGSTSSVSNSTTESASSTTSTSSSGTSSSSSGTVPSSSTSGAASSSASADPEETKDSPSLPPGILTMVVLAAAFALRRRFELNRVGQ